MKPKLSQRFLVTLCLLAGLWALPAGAHHVSRSFLKLSFETNQTTASWALPLLDLQLSVGIDADDDGAYSREELFARHRAVTDYALGRLEIKFDETPVEFRLTGDEPRIDVFRGEPYYLLSFELVAEPEPVNVEVHYNVFFDDNNLHVGFLEVDYAGANQVFSFNPDQTAMTLQIANPRPWRQFLTFAWEGVWHIWIGFDHILFLIALLLPAVLKREEKKWQAVAGFRAAFWNVVKIVTAFTVAHSVTLSLAALELVNLPSRGVEAAIAASVIVAAANNLRPVVRERVWLVAFGFGLVHGFGFANVLTELGLPRGTLALALVGFNLGVEAGQLAIVAVFFPLAYAMRRTAFYRRLILPAGSALIALIALAWLIERVLDLELMPF